MLWFFFIISILKSIKFCLYIFYYLFLKIIVMYICMIKLRILGFKDDGYYEIF